MSTSPDEQHGDWYEIRLQGRLGARWSTWLGGLDLSYLDDGTTVLRGPVADQAALHGLLHKVRDLGVPLVSVTRTEPHQHNRTTAGPRPGSSPNTSQLFRRI